MKIQFCILVLCSWLLVSCSSWRTYTKDLYLNKPVKIQYKPNGDLNREWRIKYAKLKPINLNASKFDAGPPYSTDIFAEKAFLIKNDSLVYNNSAVIHNYHQLNSSMLYIPFLDSEDPVGNTYFELINTKWGWFDTAFQSMKKYNFPVIIGIVEGERATFFQTFKGNINGNSVIMQILNDGRILVQMDDALRLEIYTGLSATVQMPGKIIYLLQGAQSITIEQLKQMKNQYGTSPLHYFDIRLLP